MSYTPKRPGKLEDMERDPKEDAVIHEKKGCKRFEGKKNWMERSKIYTSREWQLESSF